MSGISLTASMRSNLLSLQNIASQQDIVQNRLATGLKVSSAINNPSSYYTASSLNNRAADLTALLDAMSQGIQTIKAASEAIASGAKFLEQAKAVANQALETAENVVAKVSTEAELLAAANSGKAGLIVIEGDIILSENQSVVLGDGQSLVGSNYFGSGQASSLTFTFSGQGGSGLVVGDGARVSDLKLNYTTDTKALYEYTGVIKVSAGSKDVVLKNLDISFDMTVSAGTNDAIAGIYAEGKTVEVSLQGLINIRDLSPLNINDGNNANSIYSRGIVGKIKSEPGLIENSASFTIENKSVVNIETNAKYGHGFCWTDVTMKGNSEVNIEVNGYNSNAFVASNLTMEDSSRLNYNSIYSGGLFEEANVRLNSAQVLINSAINGSSMWTDIGGITSVIGAGIIVNGQYYECKTEIVSPASFTVGLVPPAAFEITSQTAPALPDIDMEMDKFSNIKNQNKTDEKSKQYQEILRQYNLLIADASYKGINLLEGQYLKINFNEDRSSKIDVPGVKADSESLGLKTKVWEGSFEIEQSISELEEAINSLRNFASQFGNYYSIVTTRQDFTENLINVLEEGADKLTLADMNQESANMLALQTSQQLAVNSLSLASQASQGILRLF